MQERRNQTTTKFVILEFTQQYSWPYKSSGMLFNID